MFARFVLYLWACLCLWCAVGCNPDAAPSDGDGTGAAALQLNVTQSSDLDLIAEAARGDARVTLEIRRRDRRGPEFQRDPDIDSPYNADLIVRNRRGYPFLASGEHGAPDGAEVSETFAAATDHEAQVADLQLAAEAADQLRTAAAVGDAFRWELRSLRALAAAALERADDALTGQIPVFAGTTEAAGTTKVQALGATSAPYAYRVSIRYASCCVALGHHSAVLLEVFDSAGAFVGMVSTHNHGRDAADPTMTTATGCPCVFTGRTAAFPNFRPYYATDVDWNGAWGDGGGCETPYGFTPGRHVCNDDSQAQYWNLKYGVAGTWSTCSDRSLRWWSPYCD